MNVIYIALFICFFNVCKNVEAQTTFSSTTVATTNRNRIIVIFEEGRFQYTGCGVPSAQYGALRLNGRLLKILGGSRSNRADWPWMVYIYGRKTKLVCGGTLLNDQWVLTAASCLATSRAEDYGLVLGKYDVRNIFGIHKNVNVLRMVFHPAFDGQTYHNDAAMLKLEKRIEFTRYIRPACLPEYGSDVDNSTGHNSMVGQSCIVLGWGVTREHNLNSLPQALIQLAVPILSEGQCRNLTGNLNGTMDTRFCAGGRSGQGTCYGDAGGPLLCKNSEGNYYVQGIASFGFGCGIENIPDVYTDVGHTSINAWIRGILLMS